MIDDDHDIIRPDYKTARQPSNGEPNRILPVDSSVQAALAHTRHELSTPVNVILGYTEMLIEEAEEQEDDNFLPDLRKIHLASQQLLTLLNDLFHPVTDDTRTQHGEIGSIGTLPTPSAAPVCTNPPTVEPAHDSEVATGSLLVVDDNAFNRDMLSRRLIRKGYDVHTADDGYQALELLKAKTFDLVLLDVIMPGISGLEVLDILRQHYSMADLPVIMATAKDQSEDVVTALQLGANDYVTKPLDFAVVLARTQTQLALKRTREDLQQLATQLEMRNRFIRDTFGRYVTDDVVATLLDSPDGLRLGGEKRNVTMLMADLRGFTSLAERLSPEQVVTVLNRYLSTMVEVILQYQGTIEEFIGDAIFIVFGAPIWRQDDAERAVACAVAMQLAMTTVNDQNRQEGLPEIEMGIGVHTGEVVVGNIGSHKRTKYGVVGSHANLTSRIESYT
ncbi:MAG: response regulator, partial [bacterium]|nr:response regulator [bacterium]